MFYWPFVLIAHLFVVGNVFADDYADAHAAFTNGDYVTAAELFEPLAV